MDTPVQTLKNIRGIKMQTNQYNVDITFNFGGMSPVDKETITVNADSDAEAIKKAEQIFRNSIPNAIIHSRELRKSI